MNTGTKRLVLSITALLVAPAFAQSGAPAVTPEAAALLDKALQYHGSALASLKTLQDTGKLTVYGPNGQAAAELTVRSLADLAKQRLRAEVYAGNELVSIEQFTPDGAHAWTKQSGTLKLPAVRARELAGALNQGIYGLRFGGQGRDAAEVLGEQTFGDARGVAVRVTTQGVPTTYLFSPQGQLLAERTQTQQLGEVTSVYSDYRTIDGLTVPMQAELLAGGQKFARMETQHATVNADLDADAFKLP